MMWQLNGMMLGRKWKRNKDDYFVFLVLLVKYKHYTIELIKYYIWNTLCQKSVISSYLLTLKTHQFAQICNAGSPHTNFADPHSKINEKFKNHRQSGSESKANSSIRSKAAL